MKEETKFFVDNLIVDNADRVDELFSCDVNKECVLCRGIKLTLKKAIAEGISDPPERKEAIELLNLYLNIED